MAMAETAPAPRVLIVDDDGDIRDGLVQVFERAGFTAYSAPDVASMERTLTAKGADLIVLDADPRADLSTLYRPVARVLRGRVL